jgi:hypothetical protein
LPPAPIQDHANATDLLPYTVPCLKNDAPYLPAQDALRVALTIRQALSATITALKVEAEVDEPEGRDPRSISIRIVKAFLVAPISHASSLRKSPKPQCSLQM